MLFIMLAIFVGQANLGSQVQTRIVVLPEESGPPTVPSNIPPCPGVNPNNPPSPNVTEPPASKPPVTQNPETYDPNASTPPECREASCWTNFEGIIQPFEGEKECIPSEPEHCKGESGQEDIVVLKHCEFNGSVSKDNCKLVDYPITNYNDKCRNSDPSIGCPDVRDIRLSDSKCMACWSWVWGTNEKIARCTGAGSRVQVIAMDECKKVPQVTGQDGWWIDRGTCGYDPTRTPPASACYQSCQVRYLNKDDNCAEQPLHPGECRLKEDGSPPY